jgi:hypothetical protein
MCGPSGAQKAIEGQQQNFFTELQNSYAQEFGGNQAILQSLTNTLEPILRGGPNQSGFSAAENAALTGSAINNAAAANRNAQVVAASSAGGNTGVTTGGQKQLQAQIASGTGQGLEGNLNQINLANAQAGRQNFYNAESGLAGVAGLENPNAAGGVAIGAGNSAFNSATTVQNMANQEQADIGGAITGLAGGFLNFANNSDALGGIGGGKIFGPGSILEGA